jgi:hypothetical protein
MSLEKKILKHLLYDDNFVRKTIPFLKDEYFQDSTEKVVFKTVFDYILKYNNSPTVDALEIEVDQIENLTTEKHKLARELVDELSVNDVSTQDTDWLIQSTEQFCQDKAIYNAIMDSIQILDGQSKTFDKGAIPNILSIAV